MRLDYNIKTNNQNLLSIEEHALCFEAVNKNNVFMYFFLKKVINNYEKLVIVISRNYFHLKKNFHIMVLKDEFYN